ncbi:MAG TPA: acetyl-CoA carboxylase biotin carboxyl carrier protein [Caulobacteraceae bacterium]|jgi:acetyl-CoA carboxylase biotin carboxyl carrier protein
MADNRRGGFTQEAKLVRQLAAVLDETGLTEIEVEVGETRVRVARTAASVAAAPVQAMSAPAAPVVAAAPAVVSAAAAAQAEEPAAPSGEAVKSPMVGTAYLSPTPGAEPFIRAGSQVSEGQTLMIIEAMKTMNPISAPRAGVVAEVLIEDGQPVEFGEPLVVLT